MWGWAPSRVLGYFASLHREKGGQWCLMDLKSIFLGGPVVVQQKQIWLVSMRMWFDPWPRSVCQGSGFVVSCGVGHRWGLDPALLWLWHRPATVAPIQPLAWELPYAEGVGLKSKKQGKKKKKKVHCPYFFLCQKWELWISNRKTGKRHGKNCKGLLSIYTKSDFTNLGCKLTSEVFFCLLNCEFFFFNWVLGEFSETHTFRVCGRVSFYTTWKYLILHVCV